MILHHRVWPLAFDNQNPLYRLTVDGISNVGCSDEIITTERAKMKSEVTSKDLMS
jgi:hypothetical protein